MDATQKERPENQDSQAVHVTTHNEDDGDTYRLTSKRQDSLAEVIAELYQKKLRRTRQADDRLRCDSGGEDVFQFEALTFDDYLRQGHCPELVWRFVAGTGGA